MKYGMLLLSIAIFMLLLSTGSGLAQSTGPVVVVKDANGPVTQGSLTLTLRSNSGCDETQTLIPNDSKLISEQFTLSVDSRGIGTFQGIAKIITPDGRQVLTGKLHGTVGLTGIAKTARPKAGIVKNSNPAQVNPCHKNGHLQGMFDAIPGNDATGNLAEIVAINFAADEIVATTSNSLPIYRAQLNGLVTIVSSQTDKITIGPDRPGYQVEDTITVSINNQAANAIQVFDEESYCTIVQLQRQDGNSWVEVSGCPLARPPIPTTISAGEVKKISLPPDTNTSPSKPAGIYRVAVSYRNLDQQGQPFGDRVTIFSQAFSVGITGNVSVTTDRNTYPFGSEINATINNGDEMIQTEDHHAYCTILYLLKQFGNDWVEVADCQLATPTRIVTINPQESVKVTLPITTGNGPGSYRVELRYFAIDSNGNPTGAQQIADSPLFTVMSPPPNPQK